jgi:ligand-binding sensor domain-containing protein
MRSTALYFLLILMARLTLAQTYSLRNFSAVDGLPQSHVNAMVEDANGYLWLGTYGGGLARFDGREFKVYTTLDGLFSNTVTSLLLDAHQNLWVVHPRGVTKFNGQRFKIIHTPGKPKFIWKIAEIGDTIFFQLGNQGTIGKIANDSILSWDKPLIPGKRIYFSLRTASRKVCYYLNDSSFLLLSATGIRNRVSFRGVFNSVNAMINYNSNILLDTDQGFYVLDCHQLKFVKAGFALKDHIVAFDSVNKDFWIEKDNALWKQPFDSKTAKEEVLLNKTVTQLLFDREGSLWIATSGNGLYKYGVTDFNKCGSDKLGSVMAIAKDKSGTVWLGSRELVSIKHGKVKHYSLNIGNPSDATSIKVSKKNELWVASYAGLGRYDSVKDNFKWYTREHGLSSQFITSIDFDDQGNLWCGTSDGGLNFYNGEKFKTISVPEGLSGRMVSDILYFSKLKTLFASSDRGLDVVKDGNIWKINLPELANTPIISMSVYKDSVMLLGSSGSGILIFDPTNSEKKIISTRDGLPSNLIYFVAPDKDNFIWIGTEQGISRLRLSNASEILELRNYGFDNGLTGVETKQNAYYLGDEKFFGLVDGVYQFNEKKNENTFSYPLHLTGVEVFYGEAASENYADSVFGFFKIPSNPILPSSKNHVTFYFNRVEKQNPKSVRYKYFLKDFDKEWSPPTDRGMVTYGNLPPGNYVFEVKAINQKGGWDSQPLSYPFTVKAPFYRTPVFSISAISFLTGLVILISYLQVRSRARKMLEIERIRHQEQENLRKEIARDFHDEMGNQLTRIINYISLMKLSQNGHATEFYNKVENAAKYLYTGTRDFIWSIDPGNDELIKLFFHIRDFGEKLFEEKGIHFRAYNEVKEKIVLPYGFSREANLIMKEAMTNAFNHSQSANVSFALRKTDEGFEMELKDDGVGFPYDELTKTNGLSNMRVRAIRIKSKLIIESHIGRGTLVQLLFPEFKTQYV